VSYPSDAIGCNQFKKTDKHHSPAETNHTSKQTQLFDAAHWAGVANETKHISTTREAHNHPILKQSHCDMTMVDPATGFFKMVEIVQKTANAIANWLEIHWFTRHPWPTETTMDKGREFTREVSETLQNEHGVKRKIITSHDPQSNSMIERCHKTRHNVIRSAQIKDKRDTDSLLSFKGVLAACQKAMNSTVHTTARATPAQLVFGRGAMLNATIQADWQFI